MGSPQRNKNDTMILSRIEILGFKSFARRTKLEFISGVTGVVGPNGCGKSNIVDAIRWVMGEQKGSVLRSEKMEQVIFSGTQARKPLGMAEVSITIENNNGMLPSEYSEVTVSRRLYRNGDSDYLLNNKKCRLKDVVDLFLDTGLGSDSYGIIEPSLINRILTDNPQERRVLFEEAAGIAKYKLRVRTAQRRLESVNDNLDRITDILSEVEKNVRNLKRQYNQAKKYEEYREQAEESEIIILAIERSLSNRELNAVRKEAGDFTVLLQDVAANRRELEEKVSEVSLSIGKAENAVREIRSVWEEHSSAVMRAENKLLIIDEKERSSISEKERTSEAVERSRQQIVYFDERVFAQRKKIEELERQVEETRAEAESVQQEFDSAEKDVNELVVVVNSGNREAEKLRSEIGVHEKEIANRRYKIASFDERAKSLSDESGAIAEKLGKLEDRKSDTSGAKRNSVESLNTIDREIEKLEESSAGIKLRLSDQERKKSSLIISAEREKSELHFLQSLIESGGDIPSGVTHLLKDRPKGILESLGNLIGVKREFASAIETALGQAANYLIADNLSNAVAALENLKKSRQGNATIVPLNAEFPMNMEPDAAVSGAIGRADQLVESDGRYRNILHHLLGTVLVVRGWEEALTIRKSGQWAGMIVTLDGESIGKFAVSGGRSEARIPVVGRKKRADELLKSIENTKKSIKTFEDEIETLTNESNHIASELKHRKSARETALKDVNHHSGQLAALNAEEAALNNRREAVSREIELIRKDKSDAQQELEQYSAKIGELNGLSESARLDLGAKKSRLSDVRTSLEVIRNELHRKQLSLNSRTGELDKIRSECNLAAARKEELQEEIARGEESIRETGDRLKAMDEERIITSGEIEQSSRLRDEWRKKLEEHELVQHELRRRRDQLDSELKKKSREEESLKEQISVLEVKTAELKSKIENKDDSALDKYGADLEAVDLPEEYDYDALQSESAKLRKKLANIGPVNLLALEEYGSQQERLDFLKTEHEDIICSKEELLETISKTNIEARSRFKEVFAKVADYFRLLFTDLFEGGSGEIELGAGDILDSEIILRANPGGKKLVHLDQLSGGEKTLTALALVFALYQVKPSPFCILDEVDAPLDDANVERFLKLIRRFTPQTQFILITHNKITMEACDFLFGVTMEEDGMSKLVSVDLNTTHKMAESP